ncbi:hypothetical protein B0H10DRAFT_2082490 [Mycena sp. CBHHK59/15]|nr:hypothetical protein B0H10DRAFT_2136237 [Mycena sp. CBHHK59/15]KAJ6600861.1 hypothetical protein B0H10DRAFT_2082490 [Mycena sp. CBHHK59/15]
MAQYNYNGPPHYATATYLLGMGPLPPPTNRELAVAYAQAGLAMSFGFILLAAMITTSCFCSSGIWRLLPAIVVAVESGGTWWG